MIAKLRTPAVLVVAGFVVLSAVLALRGYERTWQLWNVPAAWPPFMDTRVLTAGAAAYRQGVDPMVRNDADTSRRPVNYPRVWQLLYPLGLAEEHYLAVGFAFVLLFVGSLVLFLVQVGPSPAWPVLAVVFSPAVMLGIERGNTDLVIFAFVGLALILAQRRPPAGFAVLLGAFALKLFPLAALPGLLGRTRNSARWYAFVAGLLALLYLTFSLADLALIRRGTPQSNWISYGRDVVWLRAAEHDRALASQVKLGSWFALTGVCAGAVVAGGRARRALGQVRDADLRLHGFRAGAGCYLGTFLLGSNFDYRLMFVLFALPQLSAWSRSRDRLPRGLARTALAALLLSAWSLVLDRLLSSWPHGPWISFLMAEAATWLLFGVLLALGIASLPARSQAPDNAARMGCV